MIIVATCFLCLLLFLLLTFRLIAYLFRWFEISNRPGYQPPPLETSPRFPGILAADKLREALLESGSTLVMVSLLLAAWLRRQWLRGWGRPCTLAPGGQTELIVLVPGYLMNEGCMWVLRRRLRRDGFKVVVFEPGGKMLPIDEQAVLLGEFIQRTAGSVSRPLTLIGHSMGGLVCRHYVAGNHRGAQKVKRLITIGTPHQGTMLWSLGIGPAARDMRPKSAFLTQLSSHRYKQDAIQYFSIASDFDELIIPNEHAVFPGAEHHTVHLVGHFRLVLSARVYALVSQCLKKS